MVEKAAEDVCVFLLEGSDSIDLFLEIAVEEAAEIASSVVLESFPIKNSLLFYLFRLKVLLINLLQA
jgi:hypothetical protein